MSSDEMNESLIRDQHTFSVQFPSAHHTQIECCKKREANRKRYVISRSTNMSGRVKRVVSCKRKTHHLVVGSGGPKRPPSPVKSFSVNEQSSRRPVLYEDSLKFLQYKPHDSTMDPGAKDQNRFTEVSKDHQAMIDVLLGRNLRLSIASTLWKRSSGELLSFLEGLHDVSLLVDCLPVLTRSLQEETAHITVGFCVDLFPLVKTLLKSHYEDYLISALIWIQSAMEKWKSQLLKNDGELYIHSLDHRNMHVFRQQLLELWTLKERLSFTESTAEMWKVIESRLVQL